jgi:signal peptidase II
MFIQFFIIVTVLVGIDQWTKYLAVANLRPIETIPIIKDVFHFTFVQNPGAAFGILRDQRWFFILITVVILGVILYYYKTLPNQKPYTWVRVSLLLISSGAIGNFIDRVRQGYVIDFFDFRLIQWPVFNIADIYVVIGTILLSYLMLITFEKESKERDA